MKHHHLICVTGNINRNHLAISMCNPKTKNICHHKQNKCDIWVIIIETDFFGFEIIGLLFTKYHLHAFNLKLITEFMYKNGITARALVSKKKKSVNQLFRRKRKHLFEITTRFQTDLSWNTCGLYVFSSF